MIISQSQATGTNNRSSNNVKALLGELKSCSKTRNLERGKQVHAEAVESGRESSIYVLNSLINMYAKCGCIERAHQVFDSIKIPGVVSWTALIFGYAENGQGVTALDLFRNMRNGGVVPDSVTFVAALKACISLALKGEQEKCRNQGKDIHQLVVENGCDSDTYVQSTLIEMYAKGACMFSAREVFNNMKHPDVVSWTVLILGYAENGQGSTALELFCKMRSECPVPNSVTFMAALKSCATLAVKGGASEWVECRGRGRAIHNLTVENGDDSNTHVQNTLIDMYAKCGSMLCARQIFDVVKHPSVVSWTALILGYADNGQGLTALELFTRMRNGGPAPNSITFVAVLRACGLVGGLEFGRTIHSEVDTGNDRNIILVNCLVDFYAKCGSLLEAQRVFYLYPELRNIITWTALLAGFSNCGDHKSVFRLVKEMQDADFQPDCVTFLSILTCCRHAGLVEKAKECFDAMSSKYGICPTIEHYTCMVDILGRTNKIDDAIALLNHMPCNPDEVTWMSLLDACRKWKNVRMGRLAFQSLISFSDRETAYVLMGQLYGSRGMLQEQEIVMKMRKSYFHFESLH